jgi:prolyl oligopeptidase
VVETIHGTAVADPYRWLEDLDAPETRTWLDAERSLTERWDAARPGRDRIAAGLLRAFDYERVSAPVERGGRVFYTLNRGLQNQPVLFVADARGDSARPLADFERISPDGRLGFAGFQVSPRGTYVAFGLSNGGGDWTDWRIREVATGRDLPERIEWTKYYAPAWKSDESGFYYSCFPRPPRGRELTATDAGCQVRFHRLGTPAGSDPLVFARPDRPTWQFDVAVTDDGSWLVITTGDGQVGDRGLEEIHVLDLGHPGARPVPLVTGFGAEYVFVANQGPLFFLSTNDGAPRRRVIAVDVRHPVRAAWKTVVPQEEEPIDAVVRSGDRLYVSRLADARSRLVIFGLDGAPRGEIALPGIGRVALNSGRPDQPQALYSFTSFTAPRTVYRYDPATGRSEPFHAPRAVIDPADYEVEEVFYAGRDGTRIPMFLAHRRGLALDGDRPTLLTGYGGFANSEGPSFDPFHAWWLSLGGVLAVPCLRGGAEYGEAWHQAAVRTHKQTTFDDFIAAAEWLVARRYTRPARLAIRGASNGGLLVAAALTQRPDLFGAVVVHVGVLDMLRFQLAGQGRGWQGDYGSVAVPEEFRALYAYSPLHHVRNGTSYPAVLVVTGDHDTRVAPWHSFKFLAALQAAQAGPAPVLLKLEGTAGHGGGTRLKARIADTTDIAAFLLEALGVAPPGTTTSAGEGGAEGEAAAAPAGSPTAPAPGPAAAPVAPAPAPAGTPAASAPALTDLQRAWLAHAHRHPKGGWTYAHIEGGPRERGFQHGYLLAPEIARNLADSRVAWTHETSMGWDWLVRKADTLYTPKVDPENLAELDGMVEGLAAAGVRSSRAELVAYNGIIELSGYWWPEELKKLRSPASPPEKQACSAFIATGGMTRDGGVVLGHNTMCGYEGALADLILDVVPERGHRILMQSMPGWIHSGTDFFVTDAGLVGAETTIGGFDGFDPGGVPEFVRMRRATQDAGTIDEWCGIMKRDNNGAYANAWLLGDVNTGEIARLELGLRHTGFERSRDGCFTGSNVAEDLTVLRLETSAKDTDIRNSSIARRVRWKQLMAQYAGRIDLEAAQRFEADHFDAYLGRVRAGNRSLCGHSELEAAPAALNRIPNEPSGTVDAKVVDARMARRMSFAARWGSGCGTPFDAARFLKEHPQFEWMKDILRSRPSEPWVEIAAGEGR